MEIIVQKYGGSSVKDKEKLEKVCDKIINTYNKGNGVVAIVSAQGDTTNNLISKVKEYTTSTYERELDLILSTGEIQTVALLSMMLKDKGYNVMSLTGEQAGIITNGEYGAAKIVKVIKDNIEKYINDGNIVIVAGFQGVDKFGNINTLGRGGSDLSAVAIAATLNAKECQIYTDVDGVYTSDPRTIKNAQLIKKISYEEMLEAATSGAKVLHNRAVGLGKIYSIPIEVRNTQNDKEGTKIISVEKNSENYLENYGPKLITQNNNIAKITIVGDGLLLKPTYLNKIFTLATDNNIQILMVSFSEISINIIVEMSKVEKFVNVLHEEFIINVDNK